jgi:Glycosyl hydrolase catalytic core
MRNLSRLLLVLALAMPCMAQVQPTFFNMLLNDPDLFPGIPVASIRLLGRGVAWGQLCPTPSISNCQWQRLDRWLAGARKGGVTEVLYTNMKTPLWISSDPSGKCWAGPVGVCYPPRDLTSDGGGSNATYKQFIQALVDHNRQLDSNKYAKIKFWGIWNEPGAKIFWAGTNAQMVRMAKDAYAIIKAADPSALVLSPEAASSSKHNAQNAAATWLDSYFSAGGGPYADVIAFHIAPNSMGTGDHPVVEDLIRQVTPVKNTQAKHPELAGKPVWVTEGSWGDSGEANWDDMEAAAFVVRYYSLLAWEGIQRVYWFVWDGDPHACCGTLWTRQTGELPAAKAYQQTYKWLVGRTVSNCSAQGHIWSCDLIGPNFKGKMVWDDEFKKTAAYDAAGFASVRDISDAVTPLDPKAHKITVANMPVLLEPASR